ncbi:MAG: pseudouridine synthase [Flavobacteriales bacterium]|nr:pseudouridine synthase [Flavobacteriales bacterium]MCW8912927.1 pseudouridine synthase [Flavobacteriales bacterium]MCW8938729.1 pseudouridine synthase [Flavobacteriales bacterium]MCW8967946.1 pseudouridine synthase [Flavobacteriales bacterium]MCW8988928.1 pseudouridine synthase [Flavobacteriales bacterium]
MNTSVQPLVNSIEIVFEDDLLMVVNKPNNYLIHQSHYARNITEITLLETLQQQLGFPLFPVHRLDRKTSGILLLVKDKSFVAPFQALFTNNAIQKTYYAIVRGFSPATGKIDSPVKNDDTGVYKDALTNYNTINNIELDIPVHPYEKSRYSLIQLLPETGRMHQLRKHLNKINHPIVGDYKYGDRFHNRMYETQFNCNYLFLHAHSIEFIHPLSHQKMIFTADFPTDWLNMFNKFNWQLP